MIDEQNSKNYSFLARITFIGTKTMRIILAIDSIVFIIIYIFKIEPLIEEAYNKHIIPDEKHFFWVFFIVTLATFIVPAYIIGIIGKIVYHNFIKIKCPKCGEINIGERDRCIKCDYQIQDFKDNKIF